MALRLRFDGKPGEFERAILKIEEPIAFAATGAIRDAAELAKVDGRASIAAAGFSSKWQNALRADVYPSRGVSMSPAAVIRHKIPYADVFEDGAVINGKPWLWVPLSNVPVLSGGRRMTPKKFIETIGPLYTIKRPGKPPLLGAVVRMTDKRAAKGLSLALLRRGRNPGGRGTVRIVPVFVAISAAHETKRFGIRDAIKLAVSLLPTFYLRNVRSS